MVRFTQFSAAFLIAAMLAHAALTAGRPAAVLAFDSSNSMWTQIDGANKIVILRDVLARTMKSHDGRLDLGVLTYGAKEESCSAVETVAPMGQLDAESYAVSMEQVLPAKGATPLARVLRDAATMADYEKQPATIVLVADGLDNCRGDPCATAAELAGRAKNLAIHVVAFDQDQEHLSALSCIASETGGTFFAADSRATFDAAIAKAFALAESHGDGATGSNAAEKGDARPAGAVRNTQMAAAEPETPAAPADAQGQADADIPPMPPVRPEGGAAAVHRDNATDAAAAVERQLSSLPPPGPANLTLSASLLDDSAPLEEGIMWRIFDAEPDANGVFKVVARSKEARPVLRLESGKYVVHAAFGRASVTQEVDLVGEDVDTRIVLNAGFMRISAIGPDDRPLEDDDVSFSVYSSEEDQFGERKLVFANAQQDKIIRLNSGAYQIVSQYGDANAVTRGDVTIEPGKLSEVLITHRAASVTLKLVNEAGGEALADTSWSVLTPQGEIVAEAVGAFPTHTLAAGDYNVIARHDGKAYSKAFTVTSGINREVEIIAGTDETAAAPADAGPAHEQPPGQ